LNAFLNSLAATVESLPSPAANWYALATLSRFERIVAQDVAKRGINTFLPTITEVHRWSDRRKKVEVPIFAGYVFVYACMSAQVRRSATCTRGAMGFVTMQGEPVSIPNEQMQAIQDVATRSIRLAERVRASCPPLRERGEDIPLLIDHLMHRLSKTFGLAMRNLSPATLTACEAYTWPGNLRELG